MLVHTVCVWTLLAPSLPKATIVTHAAAQIRSGLAAMAETEAEAIAIAMAEAQAKATEVDSAPLAAHLVDVDTMLSLSKSDAAAVAAEADAVFAKIDTNGDGKISLDELRHHLQGSGYSVQDVEAWFIALDTAPKDGYISPAEMRASFSRYESATLRVALGLAANTDPRILAPEPESCSPRQQLADELFDMIDSNGDGVISNRELRQHLVGTGYSLITIDAIFETLDINRDGEISRAEMREGFARYDYPALRLALGLKV